MPTGRAFLAAAGAPHDRLHAGAPHAHPKPKSGPEAPATAKDVAALLRTRFNATAQPHAHCHCVLAVLDLQKTGSTQLERLVHRTRRNRTHVPPHP